MSAADRMQSGWASGEFTSETKLISTPAEVRAADAVASGRSGDGWVCYASDIVWVRGGVRTALRGGPTGLPLCGEWLEEGGKVSVHLRQTDTGWSLTRIVESAGSQRIVDQDWLSTEQHGGAPLRLRYRTLWRALSHEPAKIADGKDGFVQETFSVPVWTPVLSRFNGWK